MEPNTVAEEKAYKNPRAKSILITGFIVSSLLLIPIDPAILCVLWNWFAVKAGFHSISYGSAFGLYLMLRFVVNPGHPVFADKERRKRWADDPQDVWLAIATLFVGRALTLVVGALVHFVL